MMLFDCFSAAVSIQFNFYCFFFLKKTLKCIAEVKHLKRHKISQRQINHKFALLHLKCKSAAN